MFCVFWYDDQSGKSRKAGEVWTPHIDVAYTIAFAMKRDGFRSGIHAHYSEHGGTPQCRQEAIDARLD